MARSVIPSIKPFQQSFEVELNLTQGARFITLYDGMGKTVRKVGVTMDAGPTDRDAADLPHPLRVYNRNTRWILQR
jgi:hypothetical protein